MVYHPLYLHLSERNFEKAKLVLSNNKNSGVLVQEKIKGDHPLHTALRVDAPDELVIALYEAYPEAASSRGRDNLTAIRLAEEKRRSAHVMDSLRGIAIRRARPKLSRKKNARTSLMRMLSKTLERK